jgi:hypothetical protein
MSVFCVVVRHYGCGVCFYVLFVNHGFMARNKMRLPRCPVNQNLCTAMYSLALCTLLIDVSNFYGLQVINFFYIISHYIIVPKEETIL